MSDVGPGAPCLRVHSHHSRVKKCCWDEYGAREERSERDLGKRLIKQLHDCESQHAGAAKS